MGQLRTIKKDRLSARGEKFRRDEAITNGKGKVVGLRQVSDLSLYRFRVIK
jgi:hypothetical protein